MEIEIEIEKQQFEKSRVLFTICRVSLSSHSDARKPLSTFVPLLSWQSKSLNFLHRQHLLAAIRRNEIEN